MARGLKISRGTAQSEKEWSDEELQMAACAYADLILKHHTFGTSFAEYAEAHALIARTLKKIGEPSLAKRHERTAAAYQNMHRDPNWIPPEG